MKNEPIYILGGGAVGFPLAAFLTREGRPAVAVRTGRDDVQEGIVEVSLENGPEELTTSVRTISLAKLRRLDGMVVVAAKSHANPVIARELKRKMPPSDPLVILQNGLGIEEPFLAAGFTQIYRGVLYLTSQASSDGRFSFKAIAPSPLGVVKGVNEGFQDCVARLTTARFPFRAEGDIRREVWKKVIINVVFNSICPLLDVDNGIFARDGAARHLARELIAECVAVAARLGVVLGEEELMTQVLLVSNGSTQLISTLQDIRNGRETEVESLNMAVARLAASLEPSLPLPRTEFLGRMILAKATIAGRMIRPA